MTLRKMGPPVALAVLVLIVGAAIHGALTDRFGMTRSQQLEAFTARLGNVPETIGPWESVESEVDPEQLQVAQVTGHCARTYRHRETGDVVNVFLVCGTSRHITLHTPDKCYQAAGFVMEGQPHALSVDVGLAAPVEFATSRFYKEEAGGLQQIEILWSFSDDGRWQGPRWARTALAGHDAMYKIYLIQPINEAHGDSSGESPIVRFAKDAFPTLQQVLFPNGAKDT